MLTRVRILADYQFGRGIGVQLFPDTCNFIRSRRGGVRQVLLDGSRLATLRAHDGRLTLGYEGAKRLAAIISPPAYRVMVNDEAEGMVAGGRSVFARHCITADPAIQAGDEVLVVNREGELIATGQAVLSGFEVCSFASGVAVQVRKGRNEEE